MPLLIDQLLPERAGVRHRFRPLQAVVISCAVAGSALAQESVALSRQDGATVPIRAYAPDKGGCTGIAIISPGAGGSEKGLSYIATFLAGRGWLAVVVGHSESGREAVRQRVRGGGLRAGLSELITDPAAYEGRFMDIVAARQWARARCAAPGSILVGHSMGAATVMIEAGAKNKLGVKGADAFDAYVALSPQGSGSIFPSDAWQGIAKPVFTITGTRDDELGGESWKSRLEPFGNMPPGCKWLGIVDGATHMNLGGQGFSRRIQELTVQAIGEFLARRGQRVCAAPPPVYGIEIRVK